MDELARRASGPPGRPDLGARFDDLPDFLVDDYVVESHFETDIAGLIGQRQLGNRLREAVTPLRSYFGADARLMLTAPWHLEEPVHRLIQVVVFTRLNRQDANRALQQFTEQWQSAHPSELVFVVTPLDELWGD